MKSHCLHSLALSVGMLAAASATAQTPLSPAELQAFELKSHGAYAAARDAFLELVRQPVANSPRAAALVEFHVAMTALLAERTGAVYLREEFANLAEREDIRQHPMLRDRLLGMALDLDSSAGDLGAVVQHTRDLGFLSRWWIVGPFDNERGAGYAQAFDPERGFDPEGSYEGKKRPVQWRRLPVVEPPAGIVDLDAMVRPNDQVLCYAAVALIAENDGPVALHLGSDEAFQVFLNRQRIAGRDVARSLVADQDAVVLDLRRGPNLLMLKICEGEGDFGFCARLRQLDGRPVEGVRESDAIEDLLAASGTTPATPSSATAERGAIDVLAADADSGSAADAFRVAILMLVRDADDPTDRRDRRYAMQAVEGLPEFASARYLLAATRSQPGRAEEKDENARRHDYEAALATTPDHAESMVALGEMDLEQVGAAERAEALARRALEVNEDYTKARLLWARALRQMGLQPLADRELARAAAPAGDRARATEALDALTETLIRRGDWRRADPLLRDLLATWFRWSTIDRIGRVWLRQGRRDDWIALLERAESTAPFEKAPRQRLMRTLEAGGDAAAALVVLQRWLEICPEDDDALVDAARIHGLLGDADRQLELLRQAIELNPNRKAEARLLEFLESGTTPFHQSYEIDADAAIAADPGPPADAAEANDPDYWLLRQNVVRAYRNGTTSVYQHRILRILNDAGARRYSRWIVRHFYGEQRARILSLRVIKADGSIQRPRLSGSSAQLPPLEPGDTLDVRARIDDTAPTFFGDYFGLQHEFTAEDDAPVNRSELVLVLDEGRQYRFQRRHGVPDPAESRDDEGRLVHRYAMTAIPRRDEEERMPDAKETAPLLRVTTYGDWEQFASWWWNLIRKQVRVSPAMHAKIAELTAGLDSDMEKIAAIYGFVTTDVRYKAWEFGVHGYKPYSTDVIFERRHGDCKDKALLLTAMLGEVGIEAYPVLIHADNPRSADDLSLAMVQHFNHCISYLPPAADRPAMFLDGTATWHPVDTLPEMDHGASVLVVKGGDADLLDVPWTDPNQNVDAEELTIELRPDGNARVTLLEEPRLNQAVPLREYLGNEPGERRDNMERFLTRSYGDVRLQELDVSDPLDLDEPLRLEARFDVSALAARQGDGLALEPVFGARPLQRFTGAPTRHYPLLLGVPESESSVVRYRLPAGWAPVELPAPVKLNSPFGAFELSWQFADGELRAERKRVLKSPRIEPAEYPDFREFASQVDAAESRTVVVRKENQ